MKKFLTIILVFSIVFSMTACLSSNPNEPTEDPTLAPTQPTITDTTEDPTNPIETPSGEYDNMDKVESAAYILDRAYGNENIMFSPLSLNMALGLVAEGTGNEYNDLFLSLLDESDYPEYAKRYANYLNELNIDNSDKTYGGYKTVFQIANSLWVNNDCELNDNYVESVKPFNAQVESINFNDVTNLVKRVNDWCAEKTYDMIKEVLKESSITPESVMVAVNAVYFESPWADAWTLKDQDEQFIKFDNTKINFNPMVTTTSKYYENEKATAFGCDYANGLTFIGILPKETGEFNLRDLDIESLLSNYTTDYDVNALMPRLKFDNTIENLVEILTEMGYGELFSADGIFTNIMHDKNGDALQLTISNIIQCDSLELDENGTKAAAVTAIVMDNCASMPVQRQTKDVILDRPFAFMIYDNEMEQIVFIGKVVNP